MVRRFYRGRRPRRPARTDVQRRCPGRLVGAPAEADRVLVSGAVRDAGLRREPVPCAPADPRAAGLHGRALRALARPVLRDRRRWDGWAPNAEKVKALAANVARVHCQQLVGERPGLPIDETRPVMTVNRRIEELVDREYQYGFVTDLDTDVAPKGLTEEVVRLISAKKRRARVAARMAARRVSPLPDARGADVAERALRADRLPGHELLGGPKAKGPAPDEPRRGRPGGPRDVRQARDLARRAGAALGGRGRRRSSTRCRWRPRSRRSSPRSA